MLYYVVFRTQHNIRICNYGAFNSKLKAQLEEENEKENNEPKREDREELEHKQNSKYRKLNPIRNRSCLIKIVGT